MKKNIYVFGGIAGLILACFMWFSTIVCYNNSEFMPSAVVGYASMIIAFSLTFVSIKNYRDKYNGGVISFGKAFKIGLYVSLIASTIYVLAWLIEYYLFVPDFMDKYAQHALRTAKEKGATAAELAAKTKEMAGYKELYKNPVLVVLFTYLEVFPVGLVIALISAAILKRKNNPKTVGDIVE